MLIRFEHLLNFVADGTTDIQVGLNLLGISDEVEPRPAENVRDRHFPSVPSFSNIFSRGTKSFVVDILHKGSNDQLSMFGMTMPLKLPRVSRASSAR